MKNDGRKKCTIFVLTFGMLLLFLFSTVLIIIFPGLAASLFPDLPFVREITIRDRQIKELICELNTLREAEQEKSEEIYSLKGRISLLTERIRKYEEQTAAFDETGAESSPDKSP